MKRKDMIVKITAVCVLAVIALISFFPAAQKLTDASTYAHTIEAIDERKSTVMAFTATAATASTAIAAIPGDASSPIANQIMEISEYLFIVVCFLVLEKSLLTVMGFLACRILLPAACVLFALDLFLRRRELKVLACKLAVFAVVVASVIPLSMHISDMIYDVNRSSIEELTEDVSSVTVEEETEEEEGSWLEGIFSTVEETVSDTVEEAKETLNRFVDAIALFIITYCAIPVIVVLVLVWFVKVLFAVNIPMPGPKPRAPQGGNKEDCRAVTHT